MKNYCKASFTFILLLSLFSCNKEENPIVDQKDLLVAATHNEPSIESRNSCNISTPPPIVSNNGNNTIKVNSLGYSYEKISIFNEDLSYKFGYVCNNYGNPAIPPCNGSVNTSFTLQPGKYTLKVKESSSRKCFIPFSIGNFGWVKYFSNGVNISDVIVTNNSTNQSYTTNTDEPYNWSFGDTNSLPQLTWTSNEDDWRASVSTVDKLRLTKHLDGVELFTELGQYIAADLNADGHVDEDDLQIMTEFLALLITEFPVSNVIQDGPIVFINEVDYNLFQNELDNGVDADNFLLLLQNLSNNYSGSGENNAYAIKRGDIYGNWAN